MSVKQLLRSLDRMAKSTRTYGATNAVAVKFFTQFFQELKKHLSDYQILTFLVQRSELFYKEKCVYATEEALGENLAFRLYSDGIRELTFHEGVTEDDLRAFLDSLWGAADGSDVDDDFVTRLWGKDLSTITAVTAEEIVAASVEAELFDRSSEFFGKPPESLKDVVSREKSKGSTGRAAAVGSIGYEVPDADMQKLAEEIRAESNMDHTFLVLEMVKAILASEKSPDFLSKAIAVLAAAVDTLLHAGSWTNLIEVTALLREMEALSGTFTECHKNQIRVVLADHVKPDRLKVMEAALNRSHEVSTDGLSDYLAQFPAETVPELCALLGGLQSPEHRTLVSQVLALLGKENPDAVLRSLTDKRPHLVKAILAILVQWDDPRYADAVERLVRYPDVSVRREVLRAVAKLRPTGNGTRFVALVSDEDEMIRLNAFKLLSSGQYTTALDVWEPLLQPDQFAERTPGDRRAIFHSIRACVGDEAVPYWRGLLADWGWSGRQKKEELALLAVDALGRLGTNAAREALDYGLKKGNSTIRQACTAALNAPQPGRPA